MINDIHKQAVKHGLFDGLILGIITLITSVPVFLTDETIGKICGLFGFSVTVTKIAFEIVRKLRTLIINHKTEIAQNLINQTQTDPLNNGLLTQFGVSDPQTFVNKIDELSLYLKDIMNPQTTQAQVNDQIAPQTEFVYPTVQ